MWQAPSNWLGKPGCIREHKAVEEEANNLAEWVPEVALSRLWGAAGLGRALLIRLCCLHMNSPNSVRQEVRRAQEAGAASDAGPS